ncbi:MAG: DNA alkylation repair protein, partial [Thaumarchaeota archaeon]|nr:DNA alkylation repair protein [Nitrososphaerota archaeon]
MSSLSTPNIKYYGVRVSVLRATMKTWLNQSDLNFDERRRVVQLLWEGGSREERLIALWMVSEENDLLTAVTWNEILVWS